MAEEAAMDVEPKAEPTEEQDDDEMDVEMADEEVEAKLGEGDAEPLDVDEEDEALIKERMQKLFGKSDIYRHFIAPQAQSPTKAGKKSKGGRMKKGRMTEEEEDKLLMASSEADGSNTRKVIDRLEKQPSMLVGTTLRSYQLEGLNWMIKLYNNKISGILADEMGLGKTIQSISMLTFLSEYMNVKGKHLILVPKSCLGNWVNEFKKWSPGFNVLKFHGDKDTRIQLRNDRLAPGDFDVCLTSYEMVIKEKGTFGKHKWSYIVIDEAHRIKNENSCLSQVIRTLNSEYRLLLTGTPLQNNLHELWSLLNFLLPEIFASAEDFDEFFNLDGDGSKKALMKSLHAVIRPFLLRRLKADVEKDLPPKKETHLMTGMSEMQRYYYQKLLERDIDAVNGVGASRTRLLNILMQLRKCTNHPYLFDGAEPGPPYTNGPHLWENSGKMALLDKLLNRLKEQGSRVLIFSQMTRMLDILEDYCFVKEYQYCRIDGSTDGDTRDLHIENFNKAGSEKFLFLLSTRAGGLGINLATADVVILYDSDWNPQMDLQAMDRAHRIGQTKPVKVFRFVTENTVEQRVIERATKKLKLDALVIQQGRVTENKQASKNELISMIKYGADEVLRSKGGTVTDDDVEEILRKGEAHTKKVEEEVSKATEESMYKFTMDGGMGSVYDWEDKDYKQLSVGAGWVEPSKRDRKKNYNEDEYFRSLSAKENQGAKLPRMPKMPVTYDFQFYNSSRLNELIEKEKNAIISRHTLSTEEQVEGEDAPPTPVIEDLTEEEQAEKEKLLTEGFHDWTKRDFNNYVRACEKWGRTSLKEIVQEVEGKAEEDVKEYHKVFWERCRELDDYERILKKIEAGEEKIHRREEIERLLKEKVGQYRDPFNQLKLNYGQNKGKAFNEEEDRYLLCMSQKLGYGNWEDLKAELRSAWQFRFDWFIKSRTPAELGRRVETLIRLIEKERELDAHQKEQAKKKVAGAAAAGTGGAKRKGEESSTAGAAKKIKK
jgi:SWI/SNF-related matrix-associated actin-dependent regulator of chromatin subfamily A member 5